MKWWCCNSAYPAHEPTCKNYVPWLEARVLELERHIEEANAPRALVEALEALTDRSNEVFRLQGQIEQLKESS